MNILLLPLCILFVAIIEYLLFLFIIHYKDEIHFQYFYFKVFAVFLLNFINWLMHFGQIDCYISWSYQYDDNSEKKNYLVHFPKLKV